MPYGDIISSDYGTTNKVFRNTGFTTTVNASFNYPTNGARGADWDGTDLLMGESTLDKKQKHSGFTSTISDSHSNPDGDETAGSGWDGTNEYSTNPGTPDKIYKHSGWSSTVSSSISSPWTAPRGVGWKPDVTSLLSADTNAKKDYLHSGFTTTISSSLDTNVWATNNCWGINWDVQAAGLLTSEADTKLRTHSGFTTTIASSIAPPGSGPKPWDIQDDGQWNPQSVTPGVGSLTLAGAAPKLDLDVVPGAGAIALTGAAPTVSAPADVQLDTGLGALTLTGLVPVLDLDVIPGAGALTLTGLAASVLTPRLVTPGLGALTLTGAVPDERNEFPRVRGTAQQRTILTTNHVYAVPSNTEVGDLLLIIHMAADVGGSITFTTPTGWTKLKEITTIGGSANSGPFGVYGKIATGSDLSNFVSSGAVRSAHVAYAIKDWTGDLNDVEITTGATGTSTTPDPDSHSPSYGSGKHLWIAAAGFLDDDVTASAAPSSFTHLKSDHAAGGTGASAGYAAAQSEQEAATVNPGTFTIGSSQDWAAITISVQGESSVLLDVPVGALTLAGLAPSVLAPRLVTPDVGALALAGLVPLVVVDTPVVPGLGALVLAGAAPSIGLGPFTATPDAGVLTLSGLAPEVLLSIVALSGELTLTGLVPTVLTPRGVTAGLGQLVVTGYAPSIDLLIVPDVGSLILAGAAPSIGFNFAGVPDVGELVLTGYAPDVLRTGYGAVILLPGSGRFFVPRPGAGRGGSGAVQSPLSGVGRHRALPPGVGHA